MSSNTIVINNTTGAEYILMYKRGNTIGLYSSTSMGYVTVNRKELEENYTIKGHESEKKEQKKKDNISELTKKLEATYKELTRLKITETSTVKEIRRVEEELKDYTIRLNNLVKLLLNGK